MTSSCAVPGELLGTRQTGLADMRVADLMRDSDLLPDVQSAAEILLKQDLAAVEGAHQPLGGERRPLRPGGVRPEDT